MGAADKGHASVVTLLLADDRVEPNMANQNGYTALMRAAVKGHASVVTLLLADERVDPNMTRRKGFTALMLAARRGHAPFIVAWIENMEDPKPGAPFASLEALAPTPSS